MFILKFIILYYLNYGRLLYDIIPSFMRSRNMIMVLSGFHFSETVSITVIVLLKTDHVERKVPKYENRSISSI